MKTVVHQQFLALKNCCLNVEIKQQLVDSVERMVTSFMAKEPILVKDNVVIDGVVLRPKH